MIYRNLITLLIGIFAILGSSAWLINEPSLLEKIERNLSIWKTNYVPEKVYLQHDKPYYMAGEVIWLKAYLVHASDLSPVKKSNILYVDLLDDQNEVAEKLMLNAENGRFNGDISIPEDLEEGTYKIVAYTNWMRNFGDGTFFQKEIYIWSPEGNHLIPDSPNKEIPDLQFFPEGGDLVDGIKSRVAFKATGADGRGVNVSGAIFDESGSKAGNFTSMHHGMGAFYLEPSASKSYFAKVNFEGGLTRDYPLPEVQKPGYAIAIENNASQIQVAVSTNNNAKDNLILTGIAHDQLYYSTAFSLNNNEKKVFKIQKSSFPTGIVRFTLSKANGEPLAERLFFVDHQDLMDIEIHSNKKQFLNREQVTLEIEAKDADGKPLSTEIALAVTDEQLAVRDENERHILSYLLLTSDLKGLVEEPGYYFNSENSDRYEAMDLLLMTQGWRGFTWQEMVTDSFPKLDHSPELDIKIRGRLLKDNGDPVQMGEALLFLKDKYETFMATETDEQGNFVFDGFHFRDSIEILVQGKDQNGKFDKVNVQLENRQIPMDIQEGITPLVKQFQERINRQYIPPTLPLFQGMESDIQSMELGEFVLEEVVVEGKAEISEPFRLHSNADVVIDASQLPTAPSGNILQALQGRVAGLQIIPSGPNQFNAVIRGQGTPLFLLDGIPIDAGMLQSINQFDISRVEVLKSPGNLGIYGGRGAGGVIALYTHRGNDTIEEPEAGDHIIVQRIGGFSKSRQFYVPEYGENNSNKIRDERSTVYWNPSVKTNENGKATVSFFTTDRSTLYRVIAEGISDKGKPGRSAIFLEVY